MESAALLPTAAAELTLPQHQLEAAAMSVLQVHGHSAKSKPGAKQAQGV
jgi:hypothetical protein